MKDFSDSSWVEKRLGEVVTVTKTKGGTRPLPYVGLEDISSGGTGKFSGSLEPQGDKSTTFEFGPKHLLYGRLRPYLNKVYRPDFEGHCSSEIFPMLPDDNLDRGYLYHWITSDQVVEKINATSTGARMPRANVKEILQFVIPLPPLEEQQRIVAVLDEAFEGLARARAHAEANLQNARELFESAVNSTVLGDIHGMSHDVKGDGVPTLKSEQRKRANDKKFRGPRFVASKDEPEVPSGWAWASPEQLCTHIVDCLHATPKWAQDGEVCLRTTNFQVGELDLTETRYVSPETYAQRISRLEPKPGDVLYSREGGILGIACMHPKGLKACLGQRMMHFRLKAEFMLPEFFCAVLNSALVLGEVRHFTGGAAAPHLNIGDIRQFPIPVPPLQEQEAMVQIIEAQTESRRRLLAAYTTQLQDLDDLRQSLLQQAFAGELT